MSPGLMLATVESQQGQQVAVREMEAVRCTHPTWFHGCAAEDFEDEGASVTGETIASSRRMPFAWNRQADRQGHSEVGIGQREIVW